MKCPHCNCVGKAYVSESRNHDGEVWRRRQCGHCGRFFVTQELTAPDMRMPPGTSKRPLRAATRY